MNRGGESLPNSGDLDGSETVEIKDTGVQRKHNTCMEVESMSEREICMNVGGGLLRAKVQTSRESVRTCVERCR